jgi:hypothetical protein
MKYTFEHTIEFRNGTRTLPYRSTRYWKTVKGALHAAEIHSMEIGYYYEAGSIALHALVVRDNQGNFVTNEAA